MKKFTIIFTVLIAMTIKANAQIPNSGFENWTTLGSYEDPTGWQTTNAVSTGSFYAVTKSTDHYPITVGTYSVKIENNTVLPDISGGWLATAPFNGEPRPTFPLSGHPSSLTGYYKFAPQNGDTMAIGIVLFNAGIKVSTGVFYSTASASNWTSFNIPYPDYTTADSGFILIQSFYPGGKSSFPQGNSVLYIDNLNFDNLITSVSELHSENTAFSLFPNPASDIVTLKIVNTDNTYMTLNIYNVIGTLVKSETLNNRQINIRDLSNGVYMVSIKSKDFTETQKLIIQR